MIIVFLTTGLRLITNALLYIICLCILGQPFTASLFFQVGGLFILSWSIGFLTPGAPGGLGVREAIMLMFLNDVLSQNLLLTSAILYRIICIIGDCLVFLLAQVFSKLNKKPSMMHFRK